MEESKRAREAAGLTLAEVSRRCGIDQPALSRLENGHNKNPTLHTLWRYAAAVGRRLVLTTEAIRGQRGAKRIGSERHERSRLPCSSATNQHRGCRGRVAARAQVSDNNMDGVHREPGNHRGLRKYNGV